MRRVWPSVVVSPVCCLIPILSGCAAGPAHSEVRTITVVGRGVIHIAPDTFRLNAGVTERDEDLDVARARVAEASQRIIDVAKSFPIDERRTRTRWFNIERIADRETLEFKTYEVSQYVWI